jgi:hypothetical protein
MAVAASQKPLRGIVRTKQKKAAAGWDIRVKLRDIRRGTIMDYLFGVGNESNVEVVMNPLVKYTYEVFSLPATNGI